MKRATWGPVSSEILTLTQLSPASVKAGKSFSVMNMSAEMIVKVARISPVASILSVSVASSSQTFLSKGKHDCC